MDRTCRTIKINSSIDDIIKDLESSNDPIRSTILKKFLDIKVKAEYGENARADLSFLIKKKKNQNTSAHAQAQVREDVDKELDEIIESQNTSLSELEKINKIKAYAELISENKKDNDKKIIENTRGRVEKQWETDDLYDPRYIKYVKEDSMNNKMMERLNSEIDFRLNESNKISIEAPFDADDENNNIDTYARYNSIRYNSKRKKSIRKNNTSRK
jgi:hypothetical protein